MTFQVSNLKENYFLELLDDKYCMIELIYTKEDSWIKQFGHSKFLCVRATKVITNYAPIGEYYLRFFPCSYRSYPIKTQQHILYECRRYNQYWNPCKTSLSHLLAFLKFDPGVFSFYEGIT